MPRIFILFQYDTFLRNCSVRYGTCDDNPKNVKVVWETAPIQIHFIGNIFYFSLILWKY